MKMKILVSIPKKFSFDFVLIVVQNCFKLIIICVESTLIVEYLKQSILFYKTTEMLSIVFMLPEEDLSSDNAVRKCVSENGDQHSSTQ